MEKEMVLTQKLLEANERETQYRRYVLTAVEKIYNLYCCIATLDCEILLLSKRIKYDTELIELMAFIQTFIRKLNELAFPKEDILIQCSDWKVAIQVIPPHNSDTPLLFIAFIPEDSRHYRRAIRWAIKKMTHLHH